MSGPPDRCYFHLAKYGLPCPEGWLTHQSRCVESPPNGVSPREQHVGCRRGGGICDCAHDGVGPDTDEMLLIWLLHVLPPALRMVPAVIAPSGRDGERERERERERRGG